MIPSKKIEIFCGTGGVGKTTVACARALNLACENKKILLITIDPAKRLKQILNLKDDDDGSIHTIDSKIFIPDSHCQFDAMLMSPKATLNRIAKDKGLEKEFNSTIINTLARPYSGMNEIMSIVEVEFQLDKNYYDTIILDTPPGKHFIDFLQSSEKIQNFFDKSFLEIFEYLGKSISQNESKTKKFLSIIVSTGIKKLLTYLEDVTGKDFVNEFINSVLALYKAKDSFLRALKFQNELKRQDFSNWFLVTSVEQHKIDAAFEIKNQANQFIHDDYFLIINKSLYRELSQWNPEGEQLKNLKKSLMKKESNLIEFAKEHFSNTLYFSEVLEANPKSHVQNIAKQFEQRKINELQN